MTKQVIQIGQAPNDRTGDPLRTAFSKINDNFTELYTLTGGTAADLKELAQDYAVEMFVNGEHSGVVVTYEDNLNRLNMTLDLNIDGGGASTIYELSDLVVDGGEA